MHSYTNAYNNRLGLASRANHMKYYLGAGNAQAEGAVCADAQTPNEAYCSFSISSSACARCQVPNVAANAGAVLYRGDEWLDPMNTVCRGTDWHSYSMYVSAKGSAVVCGGHMIWRSAARTASNINMGNAVHLGRHLTAGAPYDRAVLGWLIVRGFINQVTLRPQAI